MRRGCAAIDQLHRVFCIDIDTGDPLTLVHIAAQFLLVHIPILETNIAIVCNKTQAAVVIQIVIQPVAHAAIGQHDLALCLPQTIGITGSQIIQGRFQVSITGAKIALAGNFLAIHHQLCFPDRRHGDRKAFQLGFQAQFGAALCQVIGAAQFFRAAAGANIGGILQNFHDLLVFHNGSS